MIHKKQTSKAFTLVELIVVIVILSILATIAFLSFSSQSSAARDSQRMSDLANIAKGLGALTAVSGKYPIPDSKITLTSGTGTIGYQGNAGDNVLKMINFSAGGGKDPSDKAFYTYNTNLAQNKYQLLCFLENNNLSFDLNPFSAKTYATSYSGRYPYERGDNLGIILSQSGTVYQPQQDYLTGIDINNGGTGKLTIVDNNIQVGWVSSSLSKSYASTPLIGNPFITKASDITSSTDLYSLGDTELKFIFSTGSYFTQYWSTGCNSNLNIITVTDISTGITIQPNTIVKVANGNYNLVGATKWSGHISFAGSCSALIGQSMDGTVFNGAFVSGGGLGAGLVQSNYNNNLILSNFSVNGNKSNPNRYSDGIQISYATNITTNNVRSFNNSSTAFDYNWMTNSKIINSSAENNTYGFLIGGTGNTIDSSTTNGNSSYCTWITGTGFVLNNVICYGNGNGILLNGGTGNDLKNIQSYNNTNYGISVLSSTNNNFNNIQAFNNGYVGLWFNASTNNSVNNSQFYNNYYDGLSLQGSSNNNFVNNIQTYSNGQFGIQLGGGSNNNFFNNIYAYNSIQGIYANTSDGNKYYGTMRLFSNQSGDLAGNAGNSSSLAGSSDGFLGLQNGVIDTTALTMSCSYHAQPSGLSIGGTCSTKSRQSFAQSVSSYNYGSNIITQIRPVKWNGSNFVLYGISGSDWDPAKKLGQ